MLQWIVVLLLCFALQPMRVAMAMSTYEIEPEMFTKIPDTEKGRKNTGYPDIPADTRWHGVLATAPERITVYSSSHEGSLAEYAKFPICLYFCFLSGSDDMQHVYTPTIVIRDISTGKEFEGKVHPLDDAQYTIPYAAAKGTPVSVGEFDSHNALDFVTLPVKSATYQIWLIIGSAVSNKCTVDVVISEE